MATALRVAPNSQDRSDVELVSAVRCGDDVAFEELYARYSQRIGSYVRGMVGDHGRAEDITQEIFIAALRRMRETGRPIAFKPWIYEIAKNACIDSFRRTRRAQEVSLDADDGLSSADRGRLTVVTTPDAAFDSKQALEDLRGAFGGLSESHHEILVLRELEGRSYTDIGERLGMSRPVVESTLFRARRRLAEEYDELTSGRRCEFVRNMVDSGPHYSLGIRDRRRMSRHFAHCQSCRSHARSAGFDESILNVPRVAAKIAALLPIPLLRARLGEELSADRGRPSQLAVRSVHALARTPDQIVGLGGAGRGAATAAALVLAGVGGGIVTATSSQPVKASHRTAAHAPAPGPAVVRGAGRGARTSGGQRGSPGRGTSSTSARAVASRGMHSRSGAPAGSRARGLGTSTGGVPRSSPPSHAPAISGAPSSTGGGAGAPTTPSVGAAGDTGAAGAAPTISAPTVATGGVPTGIPPVATTPTGPLPVGTTVTVTTPTPGAGTGIVGGVEGTLPQLPAPAGNGKAAEAPPIAGTVGGIVAVLGHVGGDL